jgi:hypothetical protein
MSRSKVLLMLMFATFVLAGIAEYFVPAGTPSNRAIAAAHTVIFTILCACWCQADSISRMSSVSRSALWLIVLLLPLGLAYYLFRSRDKAGAFRALSLAFAFFLVLLGGFVGGFFLTESLDSRDTEFATVSSTTAT